MSDQPTPIRLTDPDGAQVLVGGATVADQRDKVAALEARWAARRRLIDYSQKVSDRVDLARDINWDQIDQYCHPTVAQIPYVSGQSPNAGQAWGAPLPAVAADRLRLMVSYLLVENIQLATAIDLLKSLVGDLIRAANLDAPADR